MFWLLQIAVIWCGYLNEWNEWCLMALSTSQVISDHLTNEEKWMMIWWNTPLNLAETLIQTCDHWFTRPVCYRWPMTMGWCGYLKEDHWNKCIKIYTWNKIVSDFVSILIDHEGWAPLSRCMTDKPIPTKMKIRCDVWKSLHCMTFICHGPH